MSICFQNNNFGCLTNGLASVITHSFSDSFPIKNESKAACESNWKTSKVGLYLSVR